MMPSARPMRPAGATALRFLHRRLPRGADKTESGGAASTLPGPMLPAAVNPSRKGLTDAARRPYIAVRSVPLMILSRRQWRRAATKTHTAEPPPSAPKTMMNLSELKEMKILQLAKLAKDLNIEAPGALRKQDLIFHILQAQKSDTLIEAEGVLEVLPDGFGFLRSPDFSFTPGPDDIYVSPSQIRRFNLRTGDLVKGQIRQPKDSERYFTLLKVDEINFTEPVEGAQKVLFDNQTALYPTRRIN